MCEVGFPLKHVDASGTTEPALVLADPSTAAELSPAVQSVDAGVVHPVLDRRLDRDALAFGMTGQFVDLM